MRTGISPVALVIAGALSLGSPAARHRAGAQPAPPIATPGSDIASSRTVANTEQSQVVMPGTNMKTQLQVGQFGVNLDVSSSHASVAWVGGSYAVISVLGLDGPYHLKAVFGNVSGTPTLTYTKGQVPNGAQLGACTIKNGDSACDLYFSVSGGGFTTRLTLSGGAASYTEIDLTQVRPIAPKHP